MLQFTSINILKSNSQVFFYQNKYTIFMLPTP